MRRLVARSYSPRVKVAEGMIVLKLHLEVEVPVSRFKEHLKTIDWEIEVGDCQPVAGGNRRGR